jgi:hypothetical protein
MGANISPTTTGLFRRVSFTLIGNALMDTLLKNVNFSRGNQTANAPTLAQASNEVISSQVFFIHIPPQTGLIGTFSLEIEK